jgi:hypothetical protein
MWHQDAGRCVVLSGTVLALAAGTASGRTSSGFLGCPVERQATLDFRGNHQAVLTVFGSATGGTAFDLLQRSAPLLFVPLDAVERNRYEKETPLGSFGPYRMRGRARYLDVWLSPSSDRPDSDPTWTVAVSVVARIRSVDGVRWWTLRLPLDTAEGRIAAAEPFQVDPVKGGGAPPPILIAAFDTAAPGHTADVATTVKLALDFRGRRPRALARLECSWSDTRQSCSGSWGYQDATFRTGDSVACAWGVERNGFRCRFSDYAGTDWGGRLWSSFGDLETGRLVLPPPLDASHLAKLFAPTVSQASGEQPKARVAGVGTLTRLAVVESRVKGRSLCLLAARGAGLGFDPRFFLLRIDGGPAGVETKASVEELSLYDPDPRGPEADHEFRPRLPSALPDRVGPAFAVIPVPVAPRDVHTFHVVATEGTGRGLYRVGIEDDNRPVAAVARLASDIAYPFCGGRTHPASAVGMSTSEGGTLRLDMEPAYFDLGDAILVRETGERRISRQCPWTARLRWRSGRGFAWEDALVPCARPTPPRHIRIRRTGRVEVVPLEAP